MADVRLTVTVLAALLVLAAIALYSMQARPLQQPAAVTAAYSTSTPLASTRASSPASSSSSCEGGAGVCTPPANTSTTPSPFNLSGNTANAAKHAIYIMEIGDPGCPHCRAMEKFFSEKLSGVKSYFCSIAKKSCADAFWLLYNRHLTVGVPVIVVCDNTSRTIMFIEVGEYRNTTWWMSLLSTPPSGPVVYKVGERWKTLTVDEARELYQKLCVYTLRDSEPIGRAG